MDDVRTEVEWEEVKEKMMKEYPALTEDDFKAENEDKLLIHLGEKTGKTAKETRTIIKNM